MFFSYDRAVYMHVAAVAAPAWARRECSRRRPRMNRTLWVLQWLLAIFFVLASAIPKLFVPPELLPPMPIEIPRWFVVFVGVAELLGGLGLVLPGLFRIRPGLTPLAAGGLVLVTIGAI